ncbi:MAG: Bug family tripartite tricarboxylate transporter substrate binding protein [Burkholderiaceae bacterium]
MRRMTLAILSAAVALTGGAASAQEWRPTQPIIYTVPAGPGGALDQAVRMFKNIAEKRGLVDKPILIENKPGGAGRVALAPLDQNPGNPHYLSTITYSLLTNHIIGQIPGTYSDYTPLAMLFGEYTTVSVRTESPIKDAKDLVQRLKQNPSSLSIGVATSLGNHIHVGVAKPLKAAGVDITKLTVVPFKSSQESLTNLMGGHLDVMASTTPNVLAQMQQGRIRVLAIASERRLKGPLSVVPTWRELGVDSSYESAQGALAPKGIPPSAIAYWDRVFRAVTNDPEWIEFVQRQQWDPRYQNAADSGAVLDKAYRETREVLNDLGLSK